MNRSGASAGELALIGLAVAVGTVGLLGKAMGGGYDAQNIVVDGAVGGVLVGCGLALRRISGHERAGLLVSLAGIAWLAENLVTAYWQPAYSIGVLLTEISPPVVAHALLAYPTGRLPDRASRAVVVTGYACGLTMALALGMTNSWSPDVPWPRFLLLVDDGGVGARTTLADVHEIISAAFIAALLALLVRRWRAAGATERLALATVWPPAAIWGANELVHGILRPSFVGVDGQLPLGRSLAVLALGAIGACALWGAHRAAAARRTQGISVDPSATSELTRRERVVLGLMAEGRSNQAIADSLVVSPRTVETHVARIFRKLDLTPSDDEHRRVRAVLTYLGARSHSGNGHDPS